MRTIKRKVDLNQRPLTEQLRKYGISVQPIHIIGKGVPDLLIGIGGVNFLLEIKKSSNSKLTEQEKEWAKAWQGQVNTVVTIEQCLNIIINTLKHFETTEATQETKRILQILESL